MTKETIKEIIIAHIERIAKVKVEDGDKNLFGDEYDIGVVDMIYIVDAIEKEIGYPIASIFETEDITIMTVNGMANQIENILPAVG